jgi:hypothetical protein
VYEGRAAVEGLQIVFLNLATHNINGGAVDMTSQVEDLQAQSTHEISMGGTWW